MKKFFPIALLAFTSFFVYSCDNNDDDVVVQTDENVARMRDITGNFNSGNGFQIEQGINILNTDVVLVYRNVNSNGNGSTVWQLIPKTFYLDDVQNLPLGRELDYNFDFTAADVQIRTDSNFNQSTQITGQEVARYLTNQTFRLVLIPANPNKSAVPQVDYNDYNSVIKFYNLNDSNVPSTIVN